LLLIKGYGSAIVAAILFGSVSTIAKPALSDIHPILLSSIVYLVAATTMIPLLKAADKKITPSLFSIQ
jgi:drug/metabolite transporter (DMT)-like permease